ncbi:MAG TPA: hypothetical protein VGS79_19815 [Puia sp.]|nr:hypothetical protein [Puia sp.]
MFVTEKYEYTADKTFKVYSFISYGPKGAIHKIARFNELYGDIYNFGFGDYDMTSGEFSDTRVSNNEDMSIIMGTLGSIIYDFTKVFPNARVMIRGTNTARTRLYQMHLNRFWPQLEPLFVIYGLRNERWEFLKQGRNYDAFLGHRKIQ